MTAFEQYEAVSYFIVNEWVETPIYLLGEEINHDAPFVVLKTFGVLNESCLDGSIRQDSKGYTLSVYSEHRGNLEKLSSDILDKFTMKNVNESINIGDIIQGIPTQLENELYQNHLTLMVKPINHR